MEIHLGTTNSEMAAVIDGEVQVIDDAGETLLPSYVGLAPDDQLIVGTAARNQYSSTRSARSNRSIGLVLGALLEKLVNGNSLQPAAAEQIGESRRPGAVGVLERRWDDEEDFTVKHWMALFGKSPQAVRRLVRMG